MKGVFFFFLITSWMCDWLLTQEALDARPEVAVLRKIRLASQDSTKIVAAVEEGRRDGIKSLEVYNKAIMVRAGS